MMSMNLQDKSLLGSSDSLCVARCKPRSIEKVDLTDTMQEDVLMSEYYERNVSLQPLGIWIYALLIRHSSQAWEIHPTSTHTRGVQNET